MYLFPPTTNDKIITISKWAKNLSLVLFFLCFFPVVFCDVGTASECYKTGGMLYSGPIVALLLVHIASSFRLSQPKKSLVYSIVALLVVILYLPLAIVISESISSYVWYVGIILLFTPYFFDKIRNKTNTEIPIMQKSVSDSKLVTKKPATPTLVWIIGITITVAIIVKIIDIIISTR